LTLTIGRATALETTAKQALLMDYDTGVELFAKNADTEMRPASMTKMMTVYLLFERLKDGSLSLDDEFSVSTKAWRKGGSRMFLEAGSRVRVEDLIRGIVVQSGNDASIVVAEGLAGDEEAFAREMTSKARSLGMSQTTFKNASGWPDPEHKTTARDLSILIEATIRDFPDLYRYYSETSFKYNSIKQNNRNPLLYRNGGTDGLKTGHTEESGYGLSASAIRNGRRLILVINGLPSQKSRRSESERLLDRGFREFNNYALFERGAFLTNAGVWLGRENIVPLVAKEGLQLTLKRKLRKALKVTVRHMSPIPAPIEKGAPIGMIVVTLPDRNPIEIPLLAGKSVGRLGLSGRFTSVVGYLLWGEVR